jgi:uncharacterized protein YacL
MAAHDPRTIARAKRIARLVGAVIGLLVGIFYGLYIIPNSDGRLSSNVSIATATLLSTGGVGLVAGFLAGPSLSVRPYLWLEEALTNAQPGELFGGGIGLIFALLVGALITVLLGGIPNGLGYLIALSITVVLVYLFVSVGTRRPADWSNLLSHVGARTLAAAPPPSDKASPSDGQPVLVDTSVLIDARIVDVAATGFLPGRLLIPDFVLEELQRLADAGDPMRRVKGRRGLGVVEELQRNSDVVCEIVRDEQSIAADVDIRLVRLARARHSSIMTNDYNLNRIAQIEGLRVLNLNALANAMKPIVSTGETMQVSIVKEGKEPHQGVGYLEDGTMVVVENGRDYLDETVTATVTSVLQTPAGRMIFALVPALEERRPRPSRAGQAGRTPRVIKS